jgi:hypothetical protein|tara:strand:+ start:1872 stop:2306 length:435 start_codon:yes stop_codon:yes gene_type:complete
MYISVTGGKKLQRQYAKSMVEFCVRTLMPRMRTLEVSVKLCKPKDALGYCLEADTKREFELEIDKTQSLRKLLETVAHEMVHVKQFARREMHPEKDEWYGKTYNPKKVSYWDLPWEIEAHGREVGLFIRWAEANDLGKEDWTQE